MNMMIRGLLVLLIVFCLGCETTQGGGGGGTTVSSSGSSGGNKMLTDADYKRIGVKETYENR